MTTGAIINNFLLISQVTQIGANNGSEFLVGCVGLCRSGETDTQND